MSEHEQIRELLPLAAAGSLDADEQRRIEAHLRSCASCAAELETWRVLAGAIRRSPAPQLPANLLTRTRERLQREQATRSERRWSDAILAFLMLFGWTVSLVVWLMWRLMGGGSMVLAGVSFDSAVVWLGGTTLLAWLTAGAAAVVLALRPEGMRRYL